jgi:hypothetical protein
MNWTWSVLEHWFDKIYAAAEKQNGMGRSNSRVEATGVSHSEIH